MSLPATRGAALAATSVFALSVAQGGIAPSAWHSATIALLAVAAMLALVSDGTSHGRSSLIPAALVACLAALSIVSAQIGRAHV